LVVEKMSLITSIDCVLPRPDISQLHADLTTELSRRLLGGAPVLPMSSEDVLAAVMAGTINVMHGFVTQALKENDPATMCCDSLVIYSAAHGLNLRAATRAKGYVAITGVPGTPISTGMRFIGESSREYKLDPAVLWNPAVIDVNGGAVLRVVSTLGGSQFNLATGSTLTVSTTFPGIDLAATVVGVNGLQGGTDDETCEQLRRRVIAAEQAGVVTTNSRWYTQEAALFPGVSRVCLDACEGCCDSSNIVLYPFFEDVYGTPTTAPYGVPPGDVLEEMTNWMFGDSPGKGEGLAPVGITGQFAAALPTYLDITMCCYEGCPPGAAENVEAALQAFVWAQYCVGSKICLEQLKSVAYQTVGPDACFGDLIFKFDDSIGRIDSAFAYLDCAHFLVVRDVVPMETYR
jgi:Baseplate J-like protein